MNSALLSSISASELHRVINVTPQGLYHIIRELKLNSSKLGKRNFLPPQEVRKLFSSRGYKYKHEIISFSVVKGGVGKTCLSHSFAVRSSQYGARVLVIDLDQQSNISQAFGIDEDDLPSFFEVIEQKTDIKDAILPISDYLHIIPSTMNMSFLDRFIQLRQENLATVLKDHIDKISNNYDYIILDCPPAISSVTSAATLASSRIVLPIIPMKFSMHGLKASFTEISSLQKKFKKEKIQKTIIFNRFDGRKSSSTEYLTQLASSEVYKKYMMNCFIRECSELENNINQKKSIFDFNKNNSAREDIDLFTREIMGLNSKVFLN